ncbi:MAG: thioredoxin family protein, partial [Chitinophagales bacterium]
AFNVIAQELGEGDLYLQSEEYKNAQVVSESNYVVPHLFTNLAFEEVQEKAFNERKIYYVDFSASWCQPCKLMDQTTFRDYEVVKFTKENFYAVQLDMSDFDAIEMQAKYQIGSLPTILFFDHLGNLIDRTTGLQTGTLFLKKLKEIKNLI